MVSVEKSQCPKKKKKKILKLNALISKNSNSKTQATKVKF